MRGVFAARFSSICEGDLTSKSNALLLVVDLRRRFDIVLRQVFTGQFIFILRRRLAIDVRSFLDDRFSLLVDFASICEEDSTSYCDELLLVELLRYAKAVGARNTIYFR